MSASCPQCGAGLLNSPKFAGLQVICPQCHHQFVMPPFAQPVYRPNAFEASSLEQAKMLIVTPEPGITTEERWVRETDYLVSDIGRVFGLGPQHTVLDYGCGVGRVARPLIERYGCQVLGVDSSLSMRRMAVDYVQSDRFAIVSPDMLEQQLAGGLRVDFCICLWVIQHAVDAASLVERIRRALKPDGRFYAMNQLRRCVPTDQGWCDDGVDVQAELRSVFEEEEIRPLPAEAIAGDLVELTRIQVLRKRPGEA